MPAPPDPSLADPARLAALRGLALLDAPEEEAFARIARLATALLGVPVGLVSLVDADRQFFAGQVGLPEPWATGRETPLSHSFCRHVVADRAPLVVADARLDPRLRDNRAIPDLGVVAYAGVPLLDADGRALGSLCAIQGTPREWTAAEVATLRDLAALAATEFARRAARRGDARRFRALFDDAAIGIAFVDPAGFPVETNAALERLLGYTGAELRGMTFAHFTHPDDVDADLALFGELLAGARDSYRIEKRYRRKDGGELCGQLTVSLIRDEGGRPELAVGMVEDITARKAAETALRQAAESFASTFDAAGEALVIRDGPTVVAANQAYAALLGRPAAELIGRPIFGLLAPASSAEAWGRVRAGDERPFEGEVVRADGTRVPVELAGKAIRYGGRPARLVALRDITERREARAALEASAADLAEAQRVAQLGSWVFDYRARTLRYSDEAFRIGGHAPQAWVPTPERFLAAVHPADRPRVTAFLARARAGAIEAELDYRLVHPDGAVRDVFQRAELVRDAAGRPAKLVGTVQDVTARRALEARLAHQATHDPLTGLPNRALLVDRLGLALDRARRGGPADSVLFLDLDRFKEVNDTLGHDAGDRFLMAVAGRLRRHLRDADTLARLGGDEFAVLLAGIAEPGLAARAADRLLAALAAPLALDGQEHAVTASVGVVVAAADYARPEDVLRDADVAMYRAKAGGRAGYALFDPAMQAALADRLALERDLRAALAEGALTLHYQPVVDLITGRVAKVEALARWHHPTRGPVPPTEFIPLAEEAGLIADLGRWALGAACRQARAWRDAGAPIPVAVNLTAQEFQRPGLAAEVAAALAASDLAPPLLILEITESLAMRDAAATARTLAALRALGVGVAIDDFGTGYSSLAYLKRLAVDVLKIDKAFVDGLETDPEDAAIVAAIVSLGHTLGLRVLAEGVETAAQAHHLRALGCDLAQGYFFARPLPAAEVAALLGGGAHAPVAADLPSRG